VLGSRAPGASRREYTPEDLQTLQYYEEKTNEAIMILEANADVLTSLGTFYKRLVERRDFPLQGDCVEAVSAFAASIDDMVYDSRMQISRAKLLVRITADRKNLVSISTVDLSRFVRCTEMCAGITAFAEPGDRKDGNLDHEHTQYWRHVSERGNCRKDHNCGDLDLSPSDICIGKFERIATAADELTCVQTFFSTDVIKFQNQIGGIVATDPSNSPANDLFHGSFSKIALFRWLQLAVPLSILTLLVAYLAFRIADKKRRRESLPIYWMKSTGQEW
jgi:hypothetical protein